MTVRAAVHRRQSDNCWQSRKDKAGDGKRQRNKQPHRCSLHWRSTRRQESLAPDSKTQRAGRGQSVPWGQQRGGVEGPGRWRSRGSQQGYVGTCPHSEDTHGRACTLRGRISCRGLDAEGPGAVSAESRDSNGLHVCTLIPSALGAGTGTQTTARSTLVPGCRI